MKVGSAARLRMIKQLKKDGKFDERTYACKVYAYDAKQERIQIALLEGELVNLSLNAIYRCEILFGDEGVFCSGRICERYHREGQQIVQFKIEDGFYKIYLNSVDK